MSAVMTTELGNIYIDKEVIARIASLAAMECYGLVGMASRNKATGIVELLQGAHGSKGVHVTMDENKAIIELFVVLQYGTRISTVAENIIERVKYYVEKQTGVFVKTVDINVQGVRVQK